MIITENHFPINDIPKFKCPTCGQGQLRKMPNAEIKQHPAWIKNLPDGSWSEYEDEDGNIFEQDYQLSKSDVLGNEHEEYVITFLLECDKSHCQEVVSISGKLVTETESDGVSYQNWFENVYPNSFTPAVNLFEIPNAVPEIVKIEIIKSFELFWISPSACANALRISVERLMDSLNVTKVGRFGKEITLGSRIKEFEKTDKHLATLLQEIREIGNEGSHSSKLDYDDVVHAYDLIIECLNQLFEEKDKLIELADVVNKKSEEKK